MLIVLISIPAAVSELLLSFVPTVYLYNCFQQQNTILKRVRVLSSNTVIEMIFKLVLFTALFVASLATYTADWPSLDSRPIPSWYEDAKFGIFIHWGLYSVPSYGSEHFWYNWKHKHEEPYIEFMKKNYAPNFQYQDFAPMFKAELWDPVKWANLFKQAGAR